MTIGPPWDFPYATVTREATDDGGPCDVVVATGAAFQAEALADALAALLDEIEVEPLVERAPIFWYRVRSPRTLARSLLVGALAARGISVRYVASATRASLALPPALGCSRRDVARPDAWRRAARAAKAPAGAEADGLWFLGKSNGGVDADRRICGTGAGARLAVIDDDAAEIDLLNLDAALAVGVDALSSATSHGALMVAWAVGCRTQGGRAFSGVAPSASPRLYCIPKPGIDVVSLPIAIVRAASDGADVIVCATYVEGATSPMLDDALTFAWNLGRRGRGTAVVLPTGREASSPHGTVHSSWSLSLSDPASDPRVFCVGPGARGDGWFLWRDKKGKLRPFANRGPSVRWLAPGDDIAYPFSDRDRLFHAESSGASAIAAGVLLLVLANNPRLRVCELDAIVSDTTADVPPAHDPRKVPLADPRDVLPAEKDADGHNAKHGYGRLDARDACSSARDPIARALLTIGDRDARDRFEHTVRSERPYSRRLARWAVRALLADASADHALRALVRHVRLVSQSSARAAAHPAGALVRQFLVWLRGLRDSSKVARTRAASRDLDSFIARISAADSATVERAAIALAEALWRDDDERAEHGSEATASVKGISL